MLRSFLLAVFACALVTLAVEPPARAEGPRAPVGSAFGPNNKKTSSYEQKELTPARKIRKLPGSITIKVGEKVSFSKVGPCALMDPSLARMALNEKKVLTMVGRKPGSTKLFLFSRGGGGMREIPVKVTR